MIGATLHRGGAGLTAKLLALLAANEISFKRNGANHEKTIRIAGVKASVEQCAGLRARPD